MTKTPSKPETPEHQFVRQLLSEAEQKSRNASKILDQAIAYEDGIRAALYEVEKAQKNEKP